MSEETAAPEAIQENAPAEQAIENVETKTDKPVEAPKEKPTEAEKRKFKLKIDGEEKELDEEFLIKDYQKKAAAEKRFREAEQKAKETEQKYSKLKENPWDVLKELGHDPEALASDYIVKTFEERNMDPEKREMLRLKKEHEELLKFKESQEAKEKETQSQLKAQEYAVKYEAQLIEVLESGELPATNAAVSLIQQAMRERIEAAETDEEKDAVTVKDVVEDVKKYYEQELMSALKKFYFKKPEKLEAILGEEGMEAIRQLNLAKMKKPPTESTKPVQDTSPKKPKSWQEFKKQYGIDD